MNWEWGISEKQKTRYICVEVGRIETSQDVFLGRLHRLPKRYRVPSNSYFPWKTKAIANTSLPSTFAD